MPFVSTSTHLLNQGLVKESVKHNRHFLLWSAIELSVIKVANVIGNWPQVLSIALRALSVPGIAIFMLMFIFMPLLIRHFGGWLKTITDYLNVVSLNSLLFYQLGKFHEPKIIK